MMILMFLLLTDFKDWNKLRQRNHKEKEIIKVFELIEKDHWNKRAGIILSIILSVRREAAWNPSAFQRKCASFSRYYTP